VVGIGKWQNHWDKTPQHPNKTMPQTKPKILKRLINIDYHPVEIGRIVEWQPV
jgi:hypothetical protein